MNITITGRRMTIKDSLREYAEEKIGEAAKVMTIDPLDIEVVLYVEKNPSHYQPACCEVTLRTHGHIIRVEEREEDLHSAIDVAAAKVTRQMRKFKTKVVDRKQRLTSEEAAFVQPSAGGELDIDGLMSELSADEEVVRVKEIEFAPLTEQEALIQIDLLGHDFFAYTDRDTNLVCVLYRRKDGGYGLLKQRS